MQEVAIKQTQKGDRKALRNYSRRYSRKVARNWVMKHAKCSNELCSATGDFSVLLCLMWKQYMSVASGLTGRVLAGPGFVISNSMSAHTRTINNNVQSYKSLVHCNSIIHQDYHNQRTSIIRKIRVWPYIQLSLVFFLL